MTSVEKYIIRKYYAKIIEAVNKSEKEYNNNKRSKKKAKSIFESCAAQEMAISELCGFLNVQLWGDNLKLL